MITDNIQIDGITIDTQHKAMSTHYSQILWAKYFGINNEEIYGVDMHLKYFNYNYVHVTSFCLKDQEKILVYSTLDHYENTDPNRGK